MSFSFRIGRSTVCSILEETCNAIYTTLWKDYDLHHVLVTGKVSAKNFTRGGIFHIVLVKDFDEVQSIVHYF